MNTYDEYLVTAHGQTFIVGPGDVPSHVRLALHSTDKRGRHVCNVVTSHGTKFERRAS